MHDMSNRNMGRSVAKSLGNVRKFHSAWKVVTLSLNSLGWLWISSRYVNLIVLTLETVLVHICAAYCCL